ncbi:MAG TPA: nucleoside hydrolase [Alphaproteobacteria bacterium]|nr:nucleoside hydrolase [Alphaproteobacteria bacterium]
MSRIPIIIDTDPGQDDALAILLALAGSDRLDLLGITTVAGNVSLDLTTANALRILEVAGRPDVPVYLGASRPLLRKLCTAEYICGPDGLEGANLPAPTIKPREQHAVAFIIETLRKAPDRSITLCPIGPLTNLALVFAQEPALAAKVARIAMMGGARDMGNITPAAEFNFYVDPHAAQIVLQLGVPIVMFGLHATHQAVCTLEHVAKITALESKVARAVAGMTSRPRPGAKVKLGVQGHPQHDPCVIAWLLWPELFTGRDCHVAVETCSEGTIGRSTIDWWGSTRRPANAHVIERIDADGFFERLIAALATF